MIHSMALYIGGYISTASNSDKDTTEVVIYALEVLISYFTLLIYLAIGSYIIQSFIPIDNPHLSIVVFLVCFVSLRKYFGGYHADNSFVCMSISIIVPLICLILSGIINFSLVSLLLLYLLANLIGIKVGTIDNPNRRLREDQKIRFKRKGLIAIKVLFLINIVLHYFNFLEASNMMALATICGSVNLFFKK